MKGKLSGTTTSRCMNLPLTSNGTGHKFGNKKGLLNFHRVCMYSCMFSFLSVKISNKV